MTSFVLMIIWDVSSFKHWDRKMFLEERVSKFILKKSVIFRFNFHQLEKVRKVQCTGDVIGATARRKIIYL